MSTPGIALFTITDIQQALTRPLPGVNGQKKMAPASVSNEIDRWTMPASCRLAAVMLLLYPHRANGHPANLSLALIRRPQYQGAHSGQIALPGGRRENDETLQTTALRETQEELGVSPQSLTVLGQLSALYTPPSNFCIYPFVGFSANPPQFVPDNREVAELIEAPLQLFFDPALRQEEIWQFEKFGQRRVPFFYIFGHKVWGATAMILSEFITLLGQN